MKLLITGSSGFIGRELVGELERRGYAYDTVSRRADNSTTQELELTNGVKALRSISGSTIETASENVGPEISTVLWPEGIDALDLRRYTSVIHLASAPVTQASDLTEVREKNLRPVELFLKRIRESSPETSFVFVTSQSSTPDAESLYGKVKWQAEELIRKHDGPWAILRPGLVIGPGAKGLFARMLEFVRLSPIVPLVGDGTYPLQPIAVSTVVEAIVKVAEVPLKHNHADYALAIAPISLKEFLSTAAVVLKLKRLFVPIPIGLLNGGLGFVERVMKNPPITRSNLLGLLNLKVLDSKSAAEQLELELPTLRELLHTALSVTSSSNASQEQSLQQLSSEASVFHRKLFDAEPSLRLIERYALAHDYCCLVTSGMTVVDIKKICLLELDAEAIEYALRGKKTVLTKKLSLLCYLAEQEPKLFSKFVNEHSTPVLGFLTLGLSTLTAPLKLLKGRYLVWRHALV